MVTIKVEQLILGYGKHEVVKDLNFTFEPGQITGLVGPNGSGKSTIIKALSAYCDPGAAQYTSTVGI